MNRIARNALALITLTALTLGAFVTSALACGPPPAEVAVQWAVSDHMRAIKAGDAKTLKHVWLPTAKVTAINAKGVAKTGKIAPAIRKWTRTPDKKMTFKLGNIAVTGNTATVNLTLTWHGQKYSEVLTLTRQNSWSWKLAAKTHTALGKPAPTRTAGAPAY